MEDTSNLSGAVRTLTQKRSRRGRGQFREDPQRVTTRDLTEMTGEPLADAQHNLFHYHCFVVESLRPLIRCKPYMQD